jgi:hypothetical protein
MQGVLEVFLASHPAKEHLNTPQQQLRSACGVLSYRLLLLSYGDMHTQNTHRSSTRPCSLSPPRHSHDLHNQMAAVAGLVAAGHDVVCRLPLDAASTHLPSLLYLSLGSLTPSLSLTYTFTYTLTASNTQPWGEGLPQYHHHHHGSARESCPCSCCW